MDDNNETDYQTLLVKIVKIDRSKEISGQPTPHFELTGRFDEFKIKQNGDTSLSWVRKFSLGTVTNSGSLPQDVTQEMVRGQLKERVFGTMDKQVVV